MGLGGAYDFDGRWCHFDSYHPHSRYQERKRNDGCPALLRCAILYIIRSTWRKLLLCQDMRQSPSFFDHQRYLCCSSTRCRGGTDSQPTGSAIAFLMICWISIRSALLSDQPAIPSAASTCAG